MYARTVTGAVLPAFVMLALAGCAGAAQSSGSTTSPATASATAAALPTESSSSAAATIPEKAKGYLDEQEVAALAKAKTSPNRITAEAVRGLSDQQIIDKVSIKKADISSVEEYGQAFARQLDIAGMAGITPEEFRENGGPAGYTSAKGDALAAKYDKPITEAIWAEGHGYPDSADAHSWAVRMASNMMRVSMPQQFDSVTAATGTELVSGSLESGSFTVKVSAVSMDNVSESGYGKWLVENGLGYDKDDIGKGVFTLAVQLDNGVWLASLLDHTGSNVSKARPS